MCCNHRSGLYHDDSFLHVLTIEHGESVHDDLHNEALNMRVLEQEQIQRVKMLDLEKMLGMELGNLLELELHSPLELASHHSQMEQHKLELLMGRLFQVHLKAMIQELVQEKAKILVLEQETAILQELASEQGKANFLELVQETANLLVLALERGKAMIQGLELEMALALVKNQILQFHIQSGLQCSVNDLQTQHRILIQLFHEHLMRNDDLHDLFQKSMIIPYLF